MNIMEVNEISLKTLLLKNSAALSLSKNMLPVTLDDLQTSQQALLIGTTFYHRNGLFENS